MMPTERGDCSVAIIPQATPGRRFRSVGVPMAGLALGMMLAAIAAPRDQNVSSSSSPASPAMASGVVFEDLNRNGRRDPDEPGLAGVRVSNGREIVFTRADGAYQLPVTDDTILFVIKPTDWMTPVDKDQLPKFYYIHKPGGSPPLKFGGVAPTGPLPASVDFPLVRRPEQSKFRALLFGDTQPRNQREIDYLAHDIIEGLIGTDALLGVTLGDIVFDDLSLFGSLNATVGLIGIPWYNVLGNHDMNFDADSDMYSDETFERVYGPSYYSFDIARVHFVVLDNVVWIPARNNEKAHYVSGLGDRQLQWLINDLKLVTDDYLVVLMMHIPLVETAETAAIFKELSRFPFTLSLSAHQHYQEHLFLGADKGWTRPQPHHHIICATTCGSWWSGASDEYGIPHTTMADGAPNGYNIITFDNTGYSLEFRAARRPAEFQMSIHAPESVKAADARATDIFVNVFSGNEKTQVEIRVGDAGPWRRMDHAPGPDPGFVRMIAAEEKMKPPPAHKLPKPVSTTHLWKAPLGDVSGPGTFLIHVRATDMFGKVLTGQRVIRIE